MTSEIRVLHVIDSLAPSGAETSLLEMIQPLTDLAIDVHVCHLGTKDTLAESMRAAGATIWGPVSSRASRRQNIQLVRQVIASTRPHLVHTSLFEADLAGRVAARTKGVPVISSIVNDMYGADQRARVPSAQRLRLAQAADIATARLVDHFHAISEDVADKMSARLHIGRGRISVIPRGRSFERLGRRSAERREAVRTTVAIDSDHPVLLVVAREEPQKDIPTAIEALAVMRRQGFDAVLVIAGRSGIDSARVDAAVRRFSLEDRVMRLGHRTDVGDLMAAADALVMPSLWEGLGGVLIEALALECPIICTDIPVFREVTGGSHARLFPAGDTTSLAQQCRKALMFRDEEACREARTFALNRYDVANVAGQFRKMYESLAKA